MSPLRMRILRLQPLILHSFVPMIEVIGWFVCDSGFSIIHVFSMACSCWKLHCEHKNYIYIAVHIVFKSQVNMICIMIALNHILAASSNRAVHVSRWGKQIHLK